MSARRSRRVLVTGAGRGLGLEFTRRYLERGDRVFATCREPSRARDLAALSAAHPDQLTVVALDVADPDSIKGASAAVRRQTNALDLLINNAGVYSRRGSAGSPRTPTPRTPTASRTTTRPARRRSTCSCARWPRRRAGGASSRRSSTPAGSAPTWEGRRRR